MAACTPQAQDSKLQCRYSAQQQKGNCPPWTAVGEMVMADALKKIFLVALAIAVGLIIGISVSFVIASLI